VRIHLGRDVGASLRRLKTLTEEATSR